MELRRVSVDEGRVGTASLHQEAFFIALDVLDTALHLYFAHAWVEVAHIEPSCVRQVELRQVHGDHTQSAIIAKHRHPVKSNQILQQAIVVTLGDATRLRTLRVCAALLSGICVFSSVHPIARGRARSGTLARSFMSTQVLGEIVAP